MSHFNLRQTQICITLKWPGDLDQSSATFSSCWISWKDG